MLHIILAILKITGIILACIIGFILLMILLVLLVPVRYRGEAAFDGKPLFTVKIGWIPGVLSTGITNREGKLRFWLKVFGITLKDTGRPAKSGKTKNAGHTEKKKNASQPVRAENAEKAASAEKPESTENLKSTENPEGVLLPAKEKVPEEPSGNESSENESSGDESSRDESSENESSGNESSRDESSGNESSGNEFSEIVHTTEYRKKKFSFKTMAGAVRKKALSLKNKIFSAGEKVLAVKKKLLGKLESISERIKKLKTKKDKLFKLLFSDRGRRTVLYLKKNIFKVLNHVRPRRISGSLYFGLGDAYETARIAGIAAVMYPVYSPAFTITPDFQEKVLEGQIRFKGHVCPGYPVWIALKVFLNRDVRYMIHEIRNL